MKTGLSKSLDKEMRPKWLILTILASLIFWIIAGLVASDEAHAQLLLQEPADPVTSYTQVEDEILLDSSNLVHTPTRLASNGEIRYRVDVLSKGGRTWTETYIETYIEGEIYYKAMDDGALVRELWVPRLSRSAYEGASSK